MSSSHTLRRGGQRRPSLSSIIAAAALGAAAAMLHRSVGSRAALPAHAIRAGSIRSASRKPQSREIENTGKQAGTDAAAPADIPSEGWLAILRRTYTEIGNDRVLAVAGGITFYGLLSLFPAVTVAVSLYGLIANPLSISKHLSTLSTFLPEGAIAIIGGQVQRIAAAGGTGLGLAALFGLLFAMWSANSATKAMIDALNVAYEAEERRGFIRFNLVALAFTLSGIVALLLMIGVIAIIPAILQFFWLGPIADTLLNWGRWPLAFAFILMALAVLYQWGPCRPDVKWRWITPGSALASIALIIFSILFSWYAANFANYNETYGSLGAVIGFLIWLWLSATIVLVGAELNAEIENQARPGPKPGETGADKK